MIVCDVGQGDAILVIKAQLQVLIDGGPSSEKILSCLEKYVPFWDRQIELIVLTNTDFDHLNGLSAVIDRYQVMQFVTSDGVKSSDALDKLSQRIEDERIPVELVEQGDLIYVRGGESDHELEFRVLWPPEAIEENVLVFSGLADQAKREQILGASAKRGDLNERSVVLLLLEAETKSLLTGDIGFQTEQALIEQGLVGDIDILKVGHHGSKYASGEDFLSKLTPEIAIISAGKNNSYGHPTEEAIKRIRELGATIKRTDIDGSAVIELGE